MSKYKRTFDLLQELRGAGYEIITIGKPDDANPACTWVDGPYSIWCHHHTFKGYRNGDGEHKNVCKDGSWPAVWDIASKYTKGTCGNSHQKQIPFNDPTLVAGTYKVTNLGGVMTKLIAMERKELSEKLLTI